MPESDKKNHPSKVEPKRQTKKVRSDSSEKSLRSKKLVARKLRPSQKGTSVAQVDPLFSLYIREVQNYPLLSREQERELAIRWYRDKDRKALHDLVTGNLRFVVKIAYEYAHYRMKLLDLIQEGNMGLLKAVHEFDPYRDVRLTTYAVWWIRSYIQDLILKNYSLVKIGTTQAQKRLFYRLRAEQKKLEQMGIVPETQVKLLAGKLDVREKDIREMDSRLKQGDVSLNAPLRFDEKKEYIQNIADPSQPPDVVLGKAQHKQIFHSILKEFSETLQGREKVIFKERLISEKPLTLQEIGDRYGFTKERARQIEEEIKEKLKGYVKEKFPDYDID